MCTNFALQSTPSRPVICKIILVLLYGLTQHNFVASTSVFPPFADRLPPPQLRKFRLHRHSVPFVSKCAAYRLRDDGQIQFSRLRKHSPHRHRTLVRQEGFLDGASCGSRLTYSNCGNIRGIVAAGLGFAGRIEADSRGPSRFASEALYETSRLRQ